MIQELATQMRHYPGRGLARECYLALENFCLVEWMMSRWVKGMRGLANFRQTGSQRAMAMVEVIPPAMGSERLGAREVVWVLALESDLVLSACSVPREAARALR